jgi:hypothetical protein
MATHIVLECRKVLAPIHLLVAFIITFDLANDTQCGIAAGARV